MHGSHNITPTVGDTVFLFVGTLTDAHGYTVVMHSPLEEYSMFHMRTKYGLKTSLSHSSDLPNMLFHIQPDNLVCK